MLRNICMYKCPSTWSVAIFVKIEIPGGGGAFVTCGLLLYYIADLANFPKNNSKQ